MADTSKASIKLRYLWIACLPALVFILNQYVLLNYGDPIQVPPDALAEFDVYKEGAARISTLAAFILFMGAAAAALLFFVYTLRMLESRGWATMAAAFVALAVAALVLQHQVKGRNAEDYIGRSLACWATGYTKAQSDAARTVQKRKAAGEAKAGSQKPQAAEPAAPSRQGTGPEGKPAEQPAPKVELAPGVAVKYLPDPAECSAPRFRQLQTLMASQSLAMVLAFAALVLGALCCLAEPGWTKANDAEKGKAADAAEAASPDKMVVVTHRQVPEGTVAVTSSTERVAEVPPDPELLYWERQSEWLNTYLYLAALLLGTALVFLTALLRWPAYALLEAKPYEAYVASMTSYYGFTFSVMLASFYIPVATLLASKVKSKAKLPAGQGKLPNAFQGPIQLLKIVLGLFSTSLLGALPGILDWIA